MNDPDHAPARLSASRPPATELFRNYTWRISVCYAIVAAIWIFASDWLLAYAVTDEALLVRLSVYKGLTFVVITTLLLVLTLWRSFGSVETALAAARKHQQEVERLSRLHTAQSRINQAVVRVPNRDDLCARTCDVLVRDGGFCIASVRWLDPDRQQLVPIEVVGDQKHYITALSIDDSENSECFGPSSQAFSTNRRCIANDMLSDPRLQSRHSEIEASIFRSAAAFPIQQHGQAVGVLTVHSKSPHFFQDREISLLEEVATDLAFGLENYDREQLRVKAEAAAQQEKKFSDIIIESMPGIVYLYDVAGKFIRWNKNFELVTGYSGEEISNLNRLDFVPEDFRVHFEQRVADLVSKGTSAMEAPLLTRDGRSIPHFVTGQRIQLEEVTCLLGMGIDISERVRAERDVRNLNATLEHRVAKRTGELQLALRQAESADRLKSAFLATMSHELRTPLNSIIGFTGIVLQELAGPLNDEQSKQLCMVRSSARHLLELINDILDISKIEAEQVELHHDQFSLNELVREIVDSMESFTSGKPIEIISHLPAPVIIMHSDRRRLRQIIVNLVNNALKFTEVGTVTIDVNGVVDPTNREDGHHGSLAQIVVSDTGIGIKPEDMKNLFKPFRQLDNGLTRRHEGTGLGLAISHKLTLLLGGTLSVSSEYQQGTQFTAIIPTHLSHS